MSDTNSQNNSDFLQTENKVSFWLSPKIYLVAFSIILFYCISFGPLVFLMIKTEPYMKSSGIIKNADEILEIVYTPHLYGMKYSKDYFDYIVWWVELAGDKMPVSYEDFRHIR